MCGLFALWGVVYLVIGIVKKVTYQIMTGLAVILLSASMPVMNRPGFAGWILVGVAIPLAVAAVVIRFIMLFRKR